MEFFRKNPRAADTLRGPIFEDKVVDFVLELAKVTDEVVTPEDLAEGASRRRRTVEPAAGVSAGGTQASL